MSISIVKSIWASTIVLLQAFALLPSTAQSASKYRVSSTFSQAEGGNGFVSAITGLNNSGEVVGNLDFSDNMNRAFLFNGGVVRDLGAISDAPIPFSRAAGINNVGQIVGYSAGPNGAVPFIYQNGIMSELRLPYEIPLIGPPAIAYSISDSGFISGTMGYGDRLQSDHAFRCLSNCLNGSFTDLGQAWIGPSQAISVNNSGQIAGNSFYTALLFDGSNWIDLGTLGGTGSYSSDLNNFGVVVGGAQNSANITRPFAFLNGHMTDLGTLGGPGGRAYGINDRGQIVGAADVLSGDIAIHAFLFENGTMTDLNVLVDGSLPPSWVLFEANAINEFGQIAGMARTDAGKYVGVLLSPVPEPSAAALAMAGMILILMRQRNVTAACMISRPSRQPRRHRSPTRTALAQ